MIVPRYYQEKCIVEVFQWLYDHPEGNPIIGLPGGTGKSVVIAEICRRALNWYPKCRILVVAHRKELVQQNLDEFLGIWSSAPAGVFSAGLNRKDTHLPITFCGIASVAKRIGAFGHIDLMLIDECDLVSHKEDTMYREALVALKLVNPHVRGIGLTASPYRTGVGCLTEGGVFTGFSTNYTTFEGFNELLDAGFICPLIPKQLNAELPVDDVHIRGGEYVQSELQAAVDKDFITRAALTEAVRYIKDRRCGICFCTGVAHADHARDILIELGVSALSVHSSLPGGEKERDDNIAAFKAEKAKVLVSVGIVERGFNYKPIDFEIILRPTLSAQWWIQALSRATRISPETGKLNALILDFARNTKKCGYINEPNVPKKKGGSGSGMTPFRICPECATYCHPRVPVCPDCGYEFPITFKGTQKASTEELILRKKEPKPPKPPKPELPAVIESYNVDRVEFSKHQSRDTTKPPSLKAFYYCGLRIFNEYLCLQHSGFASHKAREKWRLMAGYEDNPPTTIDSALSRIGTLRLPTEIRVMHGRWDEVVGYEFNQRPVVENNPF